MPTAALWGALIAIMHAILWFILPLSGDGGQCMTVWMRGTSNRTGNRLATLAGALLSFFAASPSAAMAEEQLVPLGPWQLDSGEQSCTLTRKFGDEDAPLTLHFERFAPGDLFQVMISSKLAERLSPPYKLEIRYGAGGYLHDADYLPGTTADGTPTLWISSSTLAYRGKSKDGKPIISPDQEAAVHEISISPIGGKRLVLKTGSLGKAFAAMHSCTDELVKSWGLDPDQQRAVVMHAKPKDSPSSWIQGADYPRGVVPNGSMAIVNFRLMVDTKGEPTSCQITRSHSGEQFDKLSCDLLLRRASFEPALDAQGKPIASYYFNTVRWFISK